MNAQAEMPKYKSHKEVWALKIKMIGTNQADGSGLITPEDAGYAAFEVSAEYLEKHKPHPGGYYVVYADGYKSFSPAEAFESGYTLPQQRANDKAMTDAERLQKMGTDALEWAREFCSMFPGNDEDTMLGWFANAIEAGRSAGAVNEREACAKAAENSTYWPLEGADIAKEIRQR